jgi:hypothetical protein
MTPTDDETNDARRIAAEVAAQLETSRQVYRQIFEQVATDGRLDSEMREAAISTLTDVATCLRTLAPDFACIQVLPESEQPDLELILLRLLTDSISVALAKEPDAALLVPLAEVDAILEERPARPE